MGWARDPSLIVPLRRVESIAGYSISALYGRLFPTLRCLFFANDGGSPAYG